jgi:ribose-phosphate pyrophosphokinase
MRIKTKSGDLPFRLLTFPDGQRHFILEASERDFMEATIESRIANADELFDVLLAQDTLRASGYIVSLDVRYLLAARMDRRIDRSQPATLELVARMINAAGFQRIRVLDPHSDRTLELLRAEAVYPLHQVGLVLSHYSPSEAVLIAPDAGATVRVERLLRGSFRSFEVVQGRKKRDASTGALSGFDIVHPDRVSGKRCLILDDICDGGGTFVGLAKVLRDAGAPAVDLFVTHGIFSKGCVLEGIDQVFTTNSYWPIGHLVGPITFGVLMHPDQQLQRRSA